MVTAAEKSTKLFRVKLPPNPVIRRATAAIRSRWTPEERTWRGRVADARQEWLLRWVGVLKS
jgi:hypothetical protein